MADYYDEQFQPFIKDCKEVYNMHRIKKGDNWMFIDVGELMQNLEDEWKELQEGNNLDEQYGELIDIINVSLMMMYRIKRMKRKAVSTSEIKEEVRD